MDAASVERLCQGVACQALDIAPADQLTLGMLLRVHQGRSSVWEYVGDFLNVALSPNCSFICFDDPPPLPWITGGHQG